MGGGGRYGSLGRRKKNTCRKVPLQVNFLDDDILHGSMILVAFYDKGYLLSSLCGWQIEALKGVALILNPMLTKQKANEPEFVNV